MSEQYSCESCEWATDVTGKWRCHHEMMVFHYDKDKNTELIAPVVEPDFWCSRWTCK